jgi:hypothetical protein
MHGSSEKRLFASDNTIFHKKNIAPKSSSVFKDTTTA